MADNRIDELRRRLEKEPGSRLFAQLAEELRKEGELSEAIRVARTGLLQHPTYPSARMTLGRALLDTGDLAGARIQFETVLRGAPDNILASRFLGETLEVMGDLGSALLQYRATLRLAPGDRQIEAQIHALEERLSAPTLRKVVPQPPPARPRPPVPLVPTVTVEAPAPPPREPSPAEPPPLPPPAGPVTETPMVAVGGPAPASPMPLAPTTEVSFDLEAPFEATAAAPPAPEPSPGRRLTDEAVAEARKASPPAVAHVPLEPRPPVKQPVLTREPEPTPAPPPPAEIPGLSSSTLAELYFKQGFTDQAIEVYKDLLQREPENERLQARLAEMGAANRQPQAGTLPASGVPTADPRAERRRALEQTIARFEDMLAAMKRG